jgi:hypothetical protein
MVLEAVRGAALDVVRVRLGGVEELPLKLGVAAIEALPRLLQAAACAELTPRARYASRLPDEVRAYMDTLRLKQTEAGSFVLRIASPLGAPGERGGAPFGRRVTAQLARSVEAAAAAAAQATREARLDALEDVVPRGVSANLLDALTAFGEASETSFAIELDWASALAAPELPRRVEFERAWVPAMQRAAASFRAQPAGPRPIKLVGVVHRLAGLRSTEGDNPRLGKIGLWTNVDGKPRQVEVELTGHDYNIAVKAHAEEVPVLLRGSLDQQGKRWVLLAAHGVELWRDDADEPT